MLYQDNFIDQDTILPILEKLDFQPIVRGSRKVCQFGYEYNYFPHGISKLDQDIPPELNFNNQIEIFFNLSGS